MDHHLPLKRVSTGRLMSVLTSSSSRPLAGSSASMPATSASADSARDPAHGDTSGSTSMAIYRAARSGTLWLCQRPPPDCRPSAAHRPTEPGRRQVSSGAAAARRPPPGQGAARAGIERPAQRRTGEHCRTGQRAIVRQDRGAIRQAVALDVDGYERSVSDSPNGIHRTGADTSGQDRTGL